MCYWISSGYTNALQNALKKMQVKPFAVHLPAKGFLKPFNSIDVTGKGSVSNQDPVNIAC